MAVIDQYTRKKDGKGRLYLPKKVRIFFKSKGITELTAVDYTTHVRYFPPDSWVREKDNLSNSTADPAEIEKILSSAKTSSIQKAGRVRIPKDSNLSSSNVKKLYVELYNDFMKISVAKKEMAGALPLGNQLSLQFNSMADADAAHIYLRPGSKKLKSSGIPLAYVPLDEISIEDKTFLNRLNIDVSDIIDSIQKHGLQVPVILRGSGPYTIVSGFRRIIALLKLEKKEALSVVYPSLDDKKAYAISLIENVQRKSLSDYELIRALSHMKDFGYSAVELAVLIGKGRRIVENYLRIWNEGTESIKQALMEGRLTISAAIQAVAKNLTTDQVQGKSIRRIISETNPDNPRFSGPIYFREFGSGRITLRMKFDRTEHNIDNVISDLEHIISNLKEKREDLLTEEIDEEPSTEESEKGA